MMLRRLLPYRDLQTRHLCLLLGVARAIAWIGILLIAAGVAYGITAAVVHFRQGADDSVFATMALGTVVGLFAYGLLMLAASGVLAALVGIEESQRRRAERE